MGLVAVHPEHGLTDVAQHGRWLYAVSPRAVVRFDLEQPGPPVPVHTDERVFASLAIDASHVYVARVNAGTITRIAHAAHAERGEPAGSSSRPTILAQRSRPLNLRLRDGWLGWLDKPFITHPTLGPPYSVSATSVCAMACAGGDVAEFSAGSDGDWSLAMPRAGMVWVRRGQAGPRIVGLSRSGAALEELIDDLGDVDPDGGFVHVAATADELIVAVPTRSWLRAGVELRRHHADGRFIERVDFFPGRFNGLDASERGFGLGVEHGGAIEARFWPAGGGQRSLSVPRVPGPLVGVHVGTDGLYFAVGPEVFRV